MEAWVEIAIAVITSVFLSSGLWTFALKVAEKKDCKADMLLGLGHDRIIYLGMHYIERGCITQDEYENLYEYLYKPYEKMGGNGSAQRIMSEVNKLKIIKSDYRKGRGFHSEDPYYPGVVPSHPDANN
ncbi:MAG: hypothetical protein PHX43_05415 [Alphaproteobacteria bacterium]|nr:hypothetical protein [Alphaproteobacteria bacterium]